MENKEDREAPSVEDDVILKHQPYRKTKKQGKKKVLGIGRERGNYLLWIFVYC